MAEKKPGKWHRTKRKRKTVALPFWPLCEFSLTKTRQWQVERGREYFCIRLQRSFRVACQTSKKGRSLRCVVEWSITLWGVMKVYWFDFSLHFRSCCLLHVCRKFGPKLASHYKPVENEVKFGLSKPFRRTKSSIKKQIIVRRSVRSMFGRTNICPVKNGLNTVSPWPLLCRNLNEVFWPGTWNRLVSFASYNLRWWTVTVKCLRTDSSLELTACCVQVVQQFLEAVNCEYLKHQRSGNSALHLTVCCVQVLQQFLEAVPVNYQ